MRSPMRATRALRNQVQVCVSNKRRRLPAS
jgi:hypothetical protein